MLKLLVVAAILVAAGTAHGGWDDLSSAPSGSIVNRSDYWGENTPVLATGCMLKRELGR